MFCVETTTFSEFQNKNGAKLLTLIHKLMNWSKKKLYGTLQTNIQCDMLFYSPTHAGACKQKHIQVYTRSWECTHSKECYSIKY